MSLIFRSGGVEGYNLVDCHTLCMEKLLEELSKVVSSGEKNWILGGEENGDNWES